MSTRNVIATTTKNPVYYYDGEEKRRKLGDVLVESFDNVAAHYEYIPDPENGLWMPNSRRKYLLGVGASGITPLNPANVQEIVMEHGWRPASDFRVSRRGAGIRFFYYNPDRVWDDPINYDQSLWPGRGKIFHGLSVECNLQIHHAAVKIREGVFRMVCANGLVAARFNLGHIMFKHAGKGGGTDTELKIEDALKTRLVNPSNLPGQDTVMTSATLATVLEGLYKYYMYMYSTGAYIYENDLTLTQLAPFRKSVMGRAVFQDFHHAAGLIVRSREKDAPVTTLDLINAYTSAINRQPNKMFIGWNADEVADTVIKSIVELGNFANFFSGGPYMHMPPDSTPQDIHSGFSPQTTLPGEEISPDVWSDYLRSIAND